MPREWSIVTPEYPPDSGGIGDYTELVARRLAERGDRVRVFTRSPAGRQAAPGVEVALLPDDFGSATERLLATEWRRQSPDAVVLVQYVPQGFRRRGANAPFTTWLARRRERRFVMLHEALYDFMRDDAPHRWLLAGVTRLMLRQVARGAERVFVSTPAWDHFVERWASRHAEWLPIPATLAPDPYALLGPGDARAPSGPPVVCHFGTYGDFVTSRLEPLLGTLLACRGDLRVRLLGRGAKDFALRFGAKTPRAAERMEALVASPAEIARELASASAVLLPFGEGVTSRRTSLMNAIAVGAAIVTTEGIHSESIWRRSGAVSLYPDHHPELAPALVGRLIDEPGTRAEQCRRALALYGERFRLDVVVDALQAAYDLRTPRSP